MRQLQRYGPLPPHVDPASEEARKELLDALAVAFPKSEGSQKPEFEGDARQELLAALQQSFPQGSSSIPKITEITETEAHDTCITNVRSGDRELVQATAAVDTKSADSTSAVPSTSVTAEDTDDTSGASTSKSPSPEDLQKGLDQLTYLSSQPTEARVAWVVKKAEQLRQDGNKLFGEGDWGAASAKYRSVLDLLGERSAFPDQVQKTHDDLTVLCASNLAACALKAGDADEALQLSEKVLAIDPTHVKARFRRALAQVRRYRHPREESTPTGPDDACTLRWAAPRSQPPSAATGSGDWPVGAKAAAARAAELLDAQRELEAMCRTSPRDKMVRKAVEELFHRAHNECVHLKPPTWLFPKGMRDFEYRHCPASNEQQEETAQACDSVGLLSSTAAAGIIGPGIERNCLIFLHGFGGRKDSFAALADTLQLPKTAVIIFNAPHELPGELLDEPPGFSWFTMLDEETMDFIQPQLQEKRRLASLDRTVHLLADVVRTLVNTCAWAPAEIFLFGYGQGGSVALDMLLNPGPSPPIGCLGGVIGVATEVLPERLQQCQSTPTGLPASRDAPGVLLIHGAQDPLTKVAAVEASAKCLCNAIGDENIQLHVFPDRGGEMLRGGDAAETRCLMEFLSDHLHGVGRRGSEEAMAKLGAEPVAFAECMGEATAKLQELD